MTCRAWPRLAACLGVALSLWQAAPASAAPKKDADRLFERGLRSMEAGDFASACPALSESYALDPLLGTLFTLAECERLAGKPATSLGHYEAFLAQVKALRPAERKKHKDRERVAAEQRDAMSVIAPRLVLKLAGVPPEGTRVELDGRAIPTASLGTSTRVDPGSHEITVTTPDGVTRRIARVAEREETVVELALPAPQPKAPEMPSTSSRLPTAAIVTGSLGAAGLVVGAVGGILAIGKKSDVEAGCDERKRCTPAGKQAVDALKTDAMVSNIGFAAGAVGITAAVVLLLTRGSAPEAKAAGAKLTPLVGASGPRDVWIGIRSVF